MTAYFPSIYLRLNILITFLLFGTAFLIANDEGSPLVHEVVVHDHDSVYRYKYMYDDSGRKVVEFRTLVIGEQDVNLSQQEWVYAGDNIVLHRISDWVSGKLRVSELIRYKYENDLKTEEVYSTFNSGEELITKTVLHFYQDDRLIRSETYHGNPSSLRLTQRIVYNYDNTRSKRFEILSNQSDTLSIRYHFNYTLDDLGRTDSLMILVESDENSLPQQLYTFFYLGDTELVSMQIYKIWNEVSNRWENATRTEFEYNNLQKISREIYAHHTGMFWFNNISYGYHYDENGKLTEKVLYRAIYNKWRRLSTIHYSDLQYNRPSKVHSTFNFWGGETGSDADVFIPFYFNDEMTLRKGSRIELKYLENDDKTAVASSRQLELKVYPNPSRGIFYIDTQMTDVQHWEVYSMNGQLLVQKVNTFQTGIIDITHLQRGVYLLKVFTHDKQSFVSKIFKE